MKKESERPRRVAQVKPYANNLRLCIRRCGYKAQEVADGIGMSRNTLSDYIVGNRPAPKDCLRKIADFIGCDIEDFAYKQSIGEVSAGSAMQQATDHQGQTDVALTAPLIPERLHGRDDKTSHGQAPRTGKGHVILTRETHRPALDGVWMCSFPNRAEHPAGTTSLDSAIWFGLKLAQLMTVIMNWAKEAICYDVLQAIIDQEINMFDAMKPQYPLQDYTVSRRQALVAIAALPMALLTAVYQRGESAIVIGEFLSRCAASLAACRHLINGRELGAVEQMLPQYLPTLAMLAQRSSPHQQAATKLVIQAYQLQSILALHQNNLTAMEAFCQEAITYSRLTGDRNQYVTALLWLVRYAYFQRKRSEKVLEILSGSDAIAS